MEIYEEATLWRFQYFMKEPAKAALAYCMCVTKTVIHRKPNVDYILSGLKLPASHVRNRRTES